MTSPLVICINEQPTIKPNNVSGERVPISLDPPPHFLSGHWRQSKEKMQSVSLVEFGHVDLDVAEVGPVGGVLGPAAVHQDGQLLRVVPGVGGGPEVGLLAVPHLLHDLCGGHRQRRREVKVCVWAPR